MPKINWKNEIGNPVYPSCKTVRDWCSLLNVRARVKPCFQISGTDKWLWFAKAETKSGKIRYSNPFLVEEYTGKGNEKGNEALLANLGRTVYLLTHTIFPVCDDRHEVALGTTNN